MNTKNGKRIYDERMKVSANYPVIRGTFTTRGEYRSGVVATPHGFVSFYGDEGHGSTFRFIWNGYEYWLQDDWKLYSARGAATVAGRFAKRIAASSPLSTTER